MLVFGVCDDDVTFAELLTDHIQQKLICIPEEIEYYVKTFFSAAEVSDYIRNNPIHILLLDIDMPGTNGFQLAEALQSQSPDTIIIFVSAYDNLVYDSFRFNPFCFLRKNHLKADLPQTLQKVLDKFLCTNDTKVFDTTDGAVNLRMQDILYIESVKNYYEVHCKSQKVYRCRGTISALETELSNTNFYRIHTAFLVNMENIATIAANRKIVLCDNTAIFVSLRKWQGFHDAYMAYCRKRVILS